MSVIEAIQKDQLKKIPAFRVGDTLKVTLKIVEGGRERLQAFSGTLIARKGKGLTETITLRRISYGEGVERTLPIHSPRVEKIEVLQHGKVRRAKTYYLRGLIGKKARIQQGNRKEAEVIEPAESAAAPVKEEPKKAEAPSVTEAPAKEEKAVEPKEKTEAPKPAEEKKPAEEAKKPEKEEKPKEEKK